MSSIFEKFDLRKQQDIQIAIEFSNKIGELLIRKNGIESVIKTVDLILQGLKDDEGIKKLIQERLKKDYPKIGWNF